MFLYKFLLLNFLILLYEIPKWSIIVAQEYLSELEPQEFAFDISKDLPAVEVPRPIRLFEIERQSKSIEIEESEEEEDDDFDETFNEDEATKDILTNRSSGKSQRPTLMDIALEASAREGLLAMRHLYTVVEPDMIRNGQILQDNHPAALLSRFSAPVVESQRREMAAYATLSAAKAFRKNYDLSNELARQANTPKISLKRTSLESLCPARDPPQCMPASERYRTHDGTCNNKRRLRWGAAQMPFNRFLPPEYGDGVDSIRLSKSSGPLSSSRFVSLLVHGARDGEAPITLMLAQWGQLLDHDLTSTAQPRAINGSVPSCCGAKDFHPSCFPIKVPLDDPWLASLKVRCLEFLRSAPAQRRDCILSWREQSNQATSYIDASPIYSSSVKTSDNARIFRNGLLVFGRGNPNDDVCQRGAIATHCIRAGDGRSGEQPGLLALHHVWVGEHNRIAMKLSELNQHWSDEKIYQETRRIIGAMFQHITYREFLPVVLGREVTKLFELDLLNSGYYDGYDPKTNPSVANAFAAAAFRFGHSLVQNSYMRCDRFHNIINNNVSLHEEFQRGDIGSVGSLHRLLRGLATQRALKRDEFITPELTNHLFQTPGFPFGLDLAAINIQRGRDHGIPPYTQWRVPCGLTPINSWEEFANVVGPASARRISHAYRSVHDIDLFVGGIAERPVVGGLVGPTFACVIAQQFSNSRKGDRFWYENGGFESSFTPAQLHSVRRVTLASVLCRTVSGGTFQPHIFLPFDAPGNQRLPCGVGSLSDFDLNPWLEQDPFATLTSFTPAHELPERIFNLPAKDSGLISQDIKNNNNNLGFTNLIPSPGTGTHTSSSTVNNVLQRPITQVETKPSLHTSFQVVRDQLQINDKLDIRKKGTGAAHVTKQKPIPAINNKLDKKKVSTHQLGTTTRRTVVINNIPIELRNANGNTKKNKNNLQAKEVDDAELMTAATVADSVKNVIKKIEAENVIKTEAPLLNAEDVEEEPMQIKIDTKLDTVANSEEVLAKTEELQLSNEDQKVDKTDQNKSANITDSIDQEQATNDTVTNSNSTTTNELNNKTEVRTSRQIYDYSRLHGNQQALLSSDIDPMAHSSTSSHKRVQRKLNLPTNTADDQLRDNAKISLLNKIAKSNLTQSEQHRSSTPRTPLRPHSELNKNSTAKPLKPLRAHSELHKNSTTKAPKTNRPTTLRNIELRHYQSRPGNSRPHKVIVDSENGDNQYEIEINIKQTNKSPNSLHTTPYSQHTASSTAYNTYQYDRYGSNYHGFTSTTPLYGYYQSSATQITHSAPVQPFRTKPPTIIIVNEPEEHTTRRPGFVHSIIGWSSGNSRPFPSTQHQSGGLPDNPIISSPHSTSQGYIPPSYANSQRPTSYLPQNSIQQDQQPISTFSQSQAQVGGGIAQASSAAISNGNFGSIAGFTSANGADSTFSFNIKPKPDKNYNQRPGFADIGQYGLAAPPQRNPWQTQRPNYLNSGEEHVSKYDIPHRETIQTPFSTTNGGQSQYYKSFAKRKQSLNTIRETDVIDYDYISRTLLPLQNITILEGDEKESDEIEYDYDEDYGTAALLRKFNRDGYLRPELTLATLLKSKDCDLNLKNQTNSSDHSDAKILDDNYVMPMLNDSNASVEELPPESGPSLRNDYSDSHAKNLNNAIFAEEQQPLMEGTITIRTLDKDDLSLEVETGKTLDSAIAFAPITVLTKPERPDNWVIYDPPKDDQQILLPQMPDLKMLDNAPAAAEVPRPIKENFWLTLTNLKRRVSTKIKQEKRKGVQKLEQAAKADQVVNAEQLAKADKAAKAAQEQKFEEAQKVKPTMEENKNENR